MAATLGINPFSAIEMIAGFTETIPDVIEFVCSDRYLNRGQILYPRQATLLKVVFLQDELFTEYDYEVIDGWEAEYRRTQDDSGEGTNGIVPGVLARMQICKEQGRKWFRETVIAAGRRGSKGHIGGLAGAYVLWHYLAKGDPQGYYSVDRDKQMAAQVFGAKKEAARANQWLDLANIILGSNCYTGGIKGTNNYVAGNLGEKLEIYAPHDFARLAEWAEKGLNLDAFSPTFTIEPKESTIVAARGPASFMQFWDEMAFMVKGVSKNTAEEVWTSATPALDQFGVDAFIWQPSSPWQRMGQFYDNYKRAITFDEDDVPVWAYILMVQLTSWDLYLDWELTRDPSVAPYARPERWYSEPMPELDFDEIESWLARQNLEGLIETDDGTRGIRHEEAIAFNPLNRAIQEYGPELQLEEKANPDTFRVERRAHFANVLDAYLDPDVVAMIWQPWPDPNGEPFQMKHQGLLSISYRAHGDPSKSGKNFGISVAHKTAKDARGFSHVIFDRIHHWEPGDFDNHRLDYDFIEQAIKDEWLDAFMPDELTFDQYPMGSTLAHLQKHIAEAKYPKRVTTYERNATNKLNWSTYEAFKTACGLGLVHAPFYDQANKELLFLQDLGNNKVEHPTSGPVQTKDVADTMAIVVYELIGAEISEWMAQNLAEVPLGASQQGGIVTHSQVQQPEAIQQLAAFGRAGRTAPGAAPRRRRR